MDAKGLIQEKLGGKIMADMYQYPEYYNLVFGKRDFKKECNFITKLFSRFSQIKVSKVLDIACGTGPHMQELATRGFDVAGLDISKKMISKVNSGLKANLHFIGAYLADMSDFKLPLKFDACVCMVNSLEILTRNEQLISHFCSVAKCLKPGGIYVIELDNPAFIFSAPKPGEKPKEYKKTVKKGKIMINVTFCRFPFDFENFLERSELVLDVNDNGRKLKIINNSPIRRLTPSDINLFVRLNGKFELLKIIGNFKLDSSINDRNSGKMIVVLRKK